MTAVDDYKAKLRRLEHLAQEIEIQVRQIREVGDQLHDGRWAHLSYPNLRVKMPPEVNSLRHQFKGSLPELKDLIVLIREWHKTRYEAQVKYAALGGREKNVVPSPLGNRGGLSCADARSTLTA